MAPPKSAAHAMEIDRLATQLAKDPHSKAFLPLAEAYCKVGMWEEAVSVLEDGLKHYPGFITAMVVLGRAYDQLKRPTMARAVLEGAVKLSPDNLRAHRTLGKIYAAEGLTVEALNSCRVILSLHPTDEEAMSLQASLQAQERQAIDASSPSQHSAVANVRQPPPVLESENASTTHLTLASQAETMSQPKPVTGQTATVAVLQSWLRSIDRQRRDRPASEITDSNP